MQKRIDKKHITLLRSLIALALYVFIGAILFVLNIFIENPHDFFMLLGVWIFFGPLMAYSVGVSIVSNKGKIGLNDSSTSRGWMLTAGISFVVMATLVLVAFSPK